MGRAAKELQSHGLAPQTRDNFRILRNMCPQRRRELQLPEPAVPQLSFIGKRTSNFLKKIANRDKASMGTFGWSGKLIKLFSGGLPRQDQVPPSIYLLTLWHCLPTATSPR